MKRRSFIRSLGTSLIGLPLAVNGMNISILSRNSIFNPLNLNTDKILILVELAGGNDGLNTIIPIDQYSNLATHRPNVLIPEGSVLNLTPETGLHPSMAGIQNMYDNGEIAIIQDVGYPNPNRSHFRATDIVHSASNSDVVLNTGYLGRYLDTEHPGYPEGYPNDTYADPFAIVIGDTVSKTCQGTSANFSIAMQDPDNLDPLATGVGSTPPDGYYGDRLSYLRTTISQANDYGEVIQGAAAAGNNLGTYPDTKLANQLKIVANLISGGLQTRIYVVRQGGYDTHNSQVVPGSPATGEHALLLEELSGAISAFQNDINLLGIQDRVLGLTYSEFGRRIKSNGSFGTDHGDSGPMILFGSKVVPGIHGSNPIIPATVTTSQAVPMQYDFRDVYHDILESWFCVDPALLQSSILLGSFVSPGTIDGPCASIVLPVDLLSFEAQPMKDHIALLWEIGQSEGFKGFEIERSENGVEFSRIGWMEELSKKDYTFRDEEAEANKRYYYRLKMVDLDGTFELSPVKTATIEAEIEQYISLYPNPASKRLNIRSARSFQRGHLFILNKKGEPVYDNESWEGGDLNIKVGHLPNGIYTVQALIGHQMTVKKFLKVD